MKFYESHYEDYLESVNRYNIHPELKSVYDTLPKHISQLGNIIVYGPPGVGKYSQVLRILQKYSSSGLKYDKKITTQTEKQDYTYHISDVHYEIDMSLLGCNSKILWRDIYSQITDIISVKNEKCGVIVCRNFHMIHTELLEIFYSYMQQHGLGINLKFILITEHISFIPNNIQNASHVINVGRPTKAQYAMIDRSRSEEDFVNRIARLNHDSTRPNMQCVNILRGIDTSEITNGKEIKGFSLIREGEIPTDIFNIICDNIITEMKNHEKISMAGFRDCIYDMLIYNLDVTECIWYILYYFIQNENLTNEVVSDILDRCYVFLKYYNNNYRPIYHLESILFYLIVKIYKYGPNESATRIGNR
jgi:hypothetical protein